MRSRLSSRPKSIRKPVFFASRPSLRIRPANGSPRNGRYARSPTSRRRSAWEPPSPMRGAMRFSRWSALPEKMISMRQISAADPIPQRSCRDHRIIASNRMGKLRRRNGAAAGWEASGPSARSVLGEQLSASLRESLIEQLAAINSADEAAAWAHRHMPAKNTLTAADAKMVEERFKARLSTMSDSPHPDGPSEGPPLSRDT